MAVPDDPSPPEEPVSPSVADMVREWVGLEEPFPSDEPVPRWVADVIADADVLDPEGEA